METQPSQALLEPKADLVDKTAPNVDWVSVTSMKEKAALFAESAGGRGVEGASSDELSSDECSSEFSVVSVLDRAFAPENGFVAPANILLAGPQSIYTTTTGTSWFWLPINSALLATNYSSESTFSVQGKLYFQSGVWNVLNGSASCGLGISTVAGYPTGESSVLALATVRCALFSSSSATQEINVNVSGLRYKEAGSTERNVFGLFLACTMPAQAGVYCSVTFHGSGYQTNNIVSVGTSTLQVSVTNSSLAVTNSSATPLNVVPVTGSKVIAIGSTVVSDPQLKVEFPALQRVQVMNTSSQAIPIANTAAAPMYVAPSTGSKFPVIGVQAAGDPKVECTVGNFPANQPVSIISGSVSVSNTVPVSQSGSWAVRVNNGITDQVPVQGGVVPIVVAVSACGVVAGIGTPVSVSGVIAPVTVSGITLPVSVNTTALTPIHVTTDERTTNVNVQNFPDFPESQNVVVTNAVGNPVNVTANDALIRVDTQARVVTCHVDNIPDVQDVLITNPVNNPVNVTENDALIRVSTEDRVTTVHVNNFPAFPQTQDVRVVNPATNPVNVTQNDPLIRVSTEQRVTTVHVDNFPAFPEVQNVLVVNPVDNPVNVTENDPLVRVTTNDRIVQVTTEGRVVSSRITNPSDDPARVTIIGQPVRVTTEDGSGIFKVTTDDRTVTVNVDNSSIDVHNYVQDEEHDWIPQVQDDGVQQSHNYLWQPQSQEWVREEVDQGTTKNVRLESTAHNAFAGISIPMYASNYQSPVGLPGQERIGMLGAGSSKGDGPLTAIQRLQLRSKLGLHPLALLRADPAAELMFLRALSAAEIHKRIIEQEEAIPKDPRGMDHAIEISMLGAGASVGDGPKGHRSPRTSPRESARNQGKENTSNQTHEGVDYEPKASQMELDAGADVDMSEAPSTANYLRNILEGELIMPSRIGKLETEDKEFRRTQKERERAEGKVRAQKSEDEKKVSKDNAQRRLQNRFRHSDDFLGWVLDGPRANSDFKKKLWQEAKMDRAGAYSVATSVVDLLFCPEPEATLEADLDRFNTVLDLLTAGGTLREVRAKLQSDNHWREFKRSIFYSLGENEHQNRVLFLTRDNQRRVLDAIELPIEESSGVRAVEAEAHNVEMHSQEGNVVQGSLGQDAHPHKGVAALECYVLDLTGKRELVCQEGLVKHFYKSIAQTDRELNRRWRQMAKRNRAQGLSEPARPGVCTLFGHPWYLSLGNDVLASCLDFFQWGLQFGGRYDVALSKMDYDELLLCADERRVSKAVAEALSCCVFFAGSYALYSQQSANGTPIAMRQAPDMTDQLRQAAGVLESEADAHNAEMHAANGNIQVSGWVRDLTNEGVEPNPGPPTDKRQETFQEIEQMPTLSSFVESLGSSDTGSDFTPDTFIGRYLAGFSSNTAALGLNATNLSTQDFQTVDNVGVLTGAFGPNERVVVPGAVLHFFEVPTGANVYALNPNPPQVVGVFELTGYSGTSNQMATPPIAPGPAVAQIEQILTMSSFFQNNRRFANGLDQTDAAATVENTRQIVSASITSILLKLEGYRAIMSMQVVPGLLPLGCAAAEYHSCMRVSPNNPPPNVIGQVMAVIPNRCVNDDIAQATIAGRILPPWQLPAVSDAAGAFVITFHASTSTVPTGRKAIQVPDTLVNMTMGNSQCVQNQSRMIPLVIYLMSLAPYPMFTPLIPINVQTSFEYDAYDADHTTLAMPHSAAAYIAGLTELHILLPMNGGSGTITQVNTAMAQTMLMPVPGPAYVARAGEPALINGAYQINAGIISAQNPLASYRLDDLIASYVCNTSTAAGVFGPCLISREMFTQVYDALSLLTGSDSDADYAWSQTSMFSVRYNPMCVNSPTQPVNVEVDPTTCPSKALWNGSMPNPLAIWAGTASGFRDVVIPRLDLDYLNALASGMYTSSRNPTSMPRSFATSQYSLRNMWLWSLSQAVGWQLLYAYHAIPSNVWMNTTAGRFNEMELMCRGHFLTSSQFSSTTDLIAFPPYSSYADVIASKISGWRPMRDAANRSPNDNFMLPSRFLSVRYQPAGADTYDLQSLNPGMITTNLTVITLFENTIRELAPWIQARMTGSKGQRYITQGTTPFQPSVDGTSWAIPCSETFDRYVAPTELLPRPNDLMYNYALASLIAEGELSDWTGNVLTTFNPPVAGNAGWIPRGQAVVSMWRRATLSASYDNGKTTIRAPTSYIQYNSMWMPCGYLPAPNAQGTLLITIPYLNIPTANLSQTTQIYGGMSAAQAPTAVVNGFSLQPVVFLPSGNTKRQPRLRALNGQSTPATESVSEVGEGLERDK